MNETEERVTGRHRWAWGLSAGLLVLGLLVWAPWARGPGGSQARARAWCVGRAELGQGWQPAPPPVDLSRVESYARAVPGLTLPQERFVATWREAGSGTEVTCLSLVYDDPAQARGLMTSQAGALLAGAFGLEPEAVRFDDADDALAWRSPAYHAVAVRREGFVGLVGSTLPPASPLAAPEPLASALLQRPLPTAVATTAR